MPATRQFFLPAVTIWVWLVYFFCSRFIPYDYRPHIWVRVLPALENVLYGANLSNILSAHKHAILDILAWLPYGIIHFGAPAVCSLLMFIFAAPGTNSRVCANLWLDEHTWRHYPTDVPVHTSLVRE
ncbi:Phosphatidylinositol:ceramide phosphoinositol transferase (IPC synthase) [Metarhizium acridum]|nr:Phosphatidylinositol:ceramide phosphoinositol transferase (IPC synthase) [Metarhizium acridum]